MKSILNNFAAAKELVGKQRSSLVLVSHVLHTPMPCEYLSDIVKAIMVVLKDELEIYSPDMHGVPVAFDEKSVKLLEKHGKTIGAQSYVHCDIKCDFIVFQPKIGQILNGIVNKVTGNTVGCLIHGCFYATIHHKNKNTDDFFSNIEIGDEISLKISKLEEDGNGVLSIIGAPLRRRSAAKKAKNVDSDDAHISDTASLVIHSPDSGIIDNTMNSSLFPSQHDEIVGNSQESNLGILPPGSGDVNGIKEDINLDFRKNKKPKKSKKEKKVKKKKEHDVNESDATTTLSESFAEQEIEKKKKKKEKDKKSDKEKKKKDENSQIKNETSSIQSSKFGMSNFEFDNLPTFSPKKKDTEAVKHKILPSNKPTVVQKLELHTPLPCRAENINSPERQNNDNEGEQNITNAVAVTKTNHTLDTSPKKKKVEKNKKNPQIKTIGQNITTEGSTNPTDSTPPSDQKPSVNSNINTFSGADKEVLKSLDLGNILSWHKKDSEPDTINNVPTTEPSTIKQKDSKVSTKKRKLGTKEEFLSPPSKRTLLDSDVALPSSSLPDAVFDVGNASSQNSEVFEHQQQALYHLQKLGINIPLSLLSSSNQSNTSNEPETGSKTNNFIVPSVTKSAKKKKSKKSKLDSVSTFPLFNPIETSTPMITDPKSSSKPEIFAYQSKTKQGTIQEIEQPVTSSKDSVTSNIDSKNNVNIMGAESSEKHQMELKHEWKVTEQTRKKPKKKKKKSHAVSTSTDIAGETLELDSSLAQSHVKQEAKIDNVEQKTKKKRRKKKIAVDDNSVSNVSTEFDSKTEISLLQQNAKPELKSPTFDKQVKPKKKKKKDKETNNDDSINGATQTLHNDSTNSLKRKKNKKKRDELGEKSKKKHKKAKSMKQEND
uniref:probable replication factor C subunit 1 n=1 Tax=Styela clava TaxID=7725 RepID=UPI00193A2EFF|nr:probable replication factor C subunit 1 [Styela clava]